MNSHIISDMDPSMCDIGCSCDELFEQDIECEIPRSRCAKRCRAKHAKTLCGVQLYYPHEDSDDYPEPIPVKTVPPDFSQRLAPLWKPNGRSLPNFEELIQKLQKLETPLTAQPKVPCNTCAQSIVHSPQPIPYIMISHPTFPTTESVYDDQTRQPFKAFIS
jgi:hypothetical protein